MQLGFPTKFWISFVFSFSRDDCYSQEKLKIVLSQNLEGKTDCIKGNVKITNEETTNGSLVYIISSRVGVSALTYTQLIFKNSGLLTLKHFKPFSSGMWGGTRPGLSIRRGFHSWLHRILYVWRALLHVCTVVSRGTVSSWHRNSLREQRGCRNWLLLPK